MRHARSDYNRIQDPAGLIPEDEPVFLLRGQDALAPATLHEYADLVENENGDPYMVKKVREHAELMATWQHHNKCKMPDMPHD